MLLELFAVFELFELFKMFELFELFELFILLGYSIDLRSMLPLRVQYRATRIHPFFDHPTTPKWALHANGGPICSRSQAYGQNAVVSRCNENIPSKYQIGALWCTGTQEKEDTNVDATHRGTETRSDDGGI